MTNMKRRVIFVGGTAYSGSTFFHLILANDPHGFACGEIKASLHPLREEHIQRECSCNQPDCTVWPSVVPLGEKQLYNGIFDIAPEAQFVVDSSKNPFWIHDQGKNLRSQGIDVSNVLIWKTPEEFGKSMKKRNRSEGWTEEWIRYHKLYFSLMDDFVAVQYRKFTQDIAVLKDTCGKLDLEYFEGKNEYWNKTHHSLGGNYSARIHLYEGEKAESYLSGGFDEDRMQRHRSIYYLDSSDPEIESEMNKGDRGREFHEIIDVLNSRDVSNANLITSNSVIPRFTNSDLMVRRAKYKARTAIGKAKFGRAQNAALQMQPSI